LSYCLITALICIKIQVGFKYLEYITWRNVLISVNVYGR
jgi:hypothetical protein